MFETAFHRAIGDWSVALPHQRMSVYRNNVAAALVAALQVRFPVTEQLVGPEFFFHMARGFAEGDRPQSPVLIDYGQRFPDFIRDFAPAASVPYLADVAALESAWWQAYHAREADVITATALNQFAPEVLGDVRLVLHPSAGLMASPFAVGSIWEAHHGGAPMQEIEINRPQTVLVARPAAEITLRVISPESFAFLSALQQGKTLAEAIESAFAVHAGFDVADQLGGAFSLGLFTGLSP